jgi:signal transduction histidine kinase
MKDLHSLKRRIGRAFILLALVLAGSFSLVAYIAVEVAEAKLVDERLEKFADKLAALHGAGQVLDTPEDVSVFVDERIPAPLRRLAPGVHELKIDGHEVQALLRLQDGILIAVVQNMDDFEKTELMIFSALGAGFVASLLLAAVLGAATGKHIAAPLSALAEAVGRSDSPNDLPSLDADDEIGVLARAFAKRTDELQQILRRERLFTGDVSHELRTPLTVMLGAADVLVAQLRERPEQLAVAERLRRVAAETAERVSAMLLLSRSPQLLDAPLILMNPLLQTELDRSRMLLAGKPIQCRLDAEGQVWVNARPELVGIIVGNLLRNACQHTERGTLLVHLTRRQLIVEDDGPGIPDNVLARLFERFVRAKEDCPEGTGLGLSIVKRVAEHIGWDVRYEAAERGGSRFILSFQAPAS